MADEMRDEGQRKESSKMRRLRTAINLMPPGKKRAVLVIQVRAGLAIQL